MADKRPKRGGAAAAPTPVAAARSRASRATADHERTEKDGTALTLEERRQMIRNEFMQEALPKAPPLPGYHLCWLTTNSSYDPLHKRLRMGYELVRKEELVGFKVDNSKFSNPEFDAYVTCNELVLAKIPSDVYQMMMEEFHHNMPNDEEQRIKERVKAEAANNQDSDGRELGEVEGFEFNSDPQRLRNVRPTFE